MGVGLIICVDAAAASRASDMLKQSGEQPIARGRIVKGDHGDVLYRHP